MRLLGDGLQERSSCFGWGCDVLDLRCLCCKSSFCPPSPLTASRASSRQATPHSLATLLSNALSYVDSTITEEPSQSSLLVLTLQVEMDRMRPARGNLPPPQPLSNDEMEAVRQAIRAHKGSDRVWDLLAAGQMRNRSAEEIKALYWQQGYGAKQGWRAVDSE